MSLATLLAFLLTPSIAQTEPWLPLNGGSFSKPPVPLSPDPLVSYVWDAANLTDPESLQIYSLYPTSVALSPTTPQGSFANLPSLTSSPSAACVVSGAGGFSVDFGVESPAWVEFVSPDLNPADLPLLSLSLSEWAEALPNKWCVPVAVGANTFRLQTNALLYEGIRFAFFNVSAPPTSPFTITSLRLTVQAKPVNYKGSFSSGDALMERVWWTGAYTVRANLEKDYIGAVLIDRGDRVAWTGDLHPSQATSMAAFGNFDFIRASLNSSKNNCNGIESYCVYWVLSLCDYFSATGDASALEYFTPFVEEKLGHARDIFPNLLAQWQFYGWDDRLGSGFINASCTESQWDFRFLVLRAYYAWYTIQKTTGNGTGETEWAAASTAGVAFVRANLPNFTAPYALGVHAAAEALSVQLPPSGAPLLTEEEAATLLATTLNDATTICSTSLFNQYFILEGLGVGGGGGGGGHPLDKAADSVSLCWGGQLTGLGATTFWEVGSPFWGSWMRPNSPVPFGENGATSLCHPWASGATAWISKNLLGVYPVTPGYARVGIAPHLTATAAAGGGQKGAVPTPHGPIAVEVSTGKSNGGIGSSSLTFSVPEGCREGAEVRLSAVLLCRLGWGCNSSGSIEEVAALLLLNGQALLDSQLLLAPPTASSGKEGGLVFSVPPGGTFTLTAVFSSSPPPPAPAHLPPLVSSSFPPLRWPATVVAVDTETKGNWQGRFGGEGYVLFQTRLGEDRVSLPPWVTSVTTFDAFQQTWVAEGGNGTLDERALLLPAFPTKGGGGGSGGGAAYATSAAPQRALGAYHCAQNHLPQFSFGVDVALAPESEGGVEYQAALYICDWDGVGRRMTVDFKRGYPSLDPITETTYIPDARGGVWVVVQLNSSFRARIAQLVGPESVVSAIMFDKVPGV